MSRVSLFVILTLSAFVASVSADASIAGRLGADADAGEEADGGVLWLARREALLKTHGFDRKKFSMLKR